MQLDLKPYQECNVLIVDDETMSRMLLSSVLAPHFHCETSDSGQAAIDYCQNHSPDIILLDMNMPDIDGLTVCKKLKSQAHSKNIPVIFVTASIDAEIENACWEVGASDYVLKPITASTLVHRVKNHLQIRLRTALLERMTFHDQLTGLYNRMYLNQEIPLMIKQVARDGDNIGLIMADIDHFKLYNDHYGHLQGDECLQQVSSIIKCHALRPKDAAIRFGGEEFLVILPYTDNAGTEKVARDLVAAVFNANLPHQKGVEGKVTLSAGFTSVPAAKVVELGMISFIEYADVPLYKAKKLGRNRYEG
jgi:diguanylate cyclase (GGDEF)-like protein